MGPQGPQGPAGPQLAPPAVYTLSNDSAGSAVAAYTRASNGNLTRRGMFPSGGNGASAGLGSQGALVFQAETNRFFAVNAGDNTISMLSLAADGRLTSVATVLSGGVRPVSITASGNVVYAVNAGDGTSANPANISGFTVNGNVLDPINGSTQALSAISVGPGQISFTPDGKFLVVTEKATNMINVFPVTSGVAGAGNPQAAAGTTPFAFVFSPEGHLVVANASGGATGASTISSYSIGTNGALTTITNALPNGQTAACWIAIAGGHAYVANFGSANISGVRVNTDGSLALIDNGVTATTGAGAIDLALSPDNGYLYSLAATPDSISIFEVNPDGTLTAMPAALTGLPANAAGLVVR